MASLYPSAEELDSYDLARLKQLATDEGIHIGRKLEKGLRVELKAHYAVQEAKTRTPKRPVRQATLKTPTQQVPSVVKRPQRVATTAAKRKADALNEPKDESVLQPLDRSSLVGRRLWFTLQHIQTTRSELINEDLGDVLTSTIEGLGEVVEALEKVVQRE